MVALKFAVWITKVRRASLWVEIQFNPCWLVGEGCLVKDVVYVWIGDGEAGVVEVVAVVPG